MSHRLVIVGSGPKAMAIASKAMVLKKLGFHTPEIIIVEQFITGSYWDGNHGFTNGRQMLGTPPEKDVGFPYYSHCWGEEFNTQVNEEMLAFSWQQYLVEEHRYSDWIDRGRPSPEHRRWADYLKWVHARVRESVTWVIGEVTKLERTQKIWHLHVGNQTLDAEGCVVTGPGRLKTENNIPIDPRVQTLDTFWKNSDSVLSIPPKSHVAVIGSGETAASMVLFLGHVRNDLNIDLIVPWAMSYSRGESYVENHVYTDPFQSNWISWTKEDRVNFIQRTDRGVFSLSAKQFLDQWDFVQIIPGWFKSIRLSSGNQLVLEIEYNGEKECRVYDFVALSLGFDPWTQVLSWLDGATLESMKKDLSVNDLTSSWVESQIAEDLSLSGLSPKLHLPMMAGLQQGPGFGNLSCLGRVSDHILQSYVVLD